MPNGAKFSPGLLFSPPQHPCLPKASGQAKQACSFLAFSFPFFALLMLGIGGEETLS